MQQDMVHGLNTVMMSTCKAGTVLPVLVWLVFKQAAMMLGDGRPSAQVVSDLGRLMAICISQDIFLEPCTLIDTVIQSKLMLAIDDSHESKMVQAISYGEKLANKFRARHREGKTVKMTIQHTGSFCRLPKNMLIRLVCLAMICYFAECIRHAITSSSKSLQGASLGWLYGTSICRTSQGSECARP